ncbi:ABC transporter permease [Acanthopleuribacter pedis]|uniref:ABC transporter permease n=1 Tax=Acanthopleuribacter pedis TaxID=442870 RepID=A0A8J7Q3Z2_9BACT|nr:ABC transporter permease subunit [Acanthopleuribacter pedis]MBO1318810.1 ABC transporter permease [Acanthopleuribacter pedis]
MSTTAVPEPRHALAAGPQANLNPVYLTLTLAKLTAKRILSRKLFWIMLILGLGPTTIAGFWVVVNFSPDIGVHTRPYGMFRDILGQYFQGFFLPVLALAMGLGVISEEIESRNITFTLVRPIHRIGIAAGRVLGHMLVGWLILITAITGSYLANIMFQIDELFATLPHLLNIMFVLCFGFAGYLCTIAMFGTFWKKPAVFISIVFLLIDWFFANLPNKTLLFVSIRYRMMNSYWEPLPRFTPSLQDITTGVASLNALIVLALFVAVPLGIMAFRLSQFEIVLSGGTQE